MIKKNIKMQRPNINNKVKKYLNHEYYEIREYELFANDMVICYCHEPTESQAA